VSLQNILPYTQKARALSKTLRKNMTLSEKLFWNEIKGKKLKFQFFRQFPILDYVVDFYCKELGLAIEIDGSSHENMFLEDSKRQERIEQLGIKFIRFSNNEIENDLRNVIKRLMDKVTEYK